MESDAPDLGLVFQTMIAYQRSAALKAAIEIDLFTAVGEGADTAAAIAERCNAAERGARILADCMTVYGFLGKQNDRYRLTPTAAVFLDRRSPGFVGSATSFLDSDMLVGAFRDVAAAVRQGGTAIPQGGTIAPEHPIWIEFNRSMAPLGAVTGQLLAERIGADEGRPWKVLDVAAGHGLFGITIAERNPNAEIVALDWANVLALAEENARKAGVAARFRALPGSALEVDYGAGYDLVLLTNILHHFDPSGCEVILRRSHAALKPGGRAVALEFVPDESRVTPPDAAVFSLVMLVTTPRGEAYTFSEYQRMFANAGFGKTELHPLPPSFQRVVIGTK